MILDLEDLKRTLQPAFTEQQTNTLATCLYEYYQPIVHQREMAAIRDTLTRVVAIQERTDERLDRIAATQDRLAASQEGMRGDIEHLVEVTKTLVWGQNDLRKQVGGIALSVGQGLEAYAMERIPTLLEQQFGYVAKSAMPEFLGPDGDTSEIDVVYRGRHEGRKIVVLCEVKTNITEAEVREFFEIVNRVRPAIAADDVRVLFFGYRAGEAARRLIAEHRCLLAFPRGIVAD
jgi:hypothetical protein